MFILSYFLKGAIFGALESLPGRSLSRMAYLEKKVLPDWDTLYEADPLDPDTEPKHTR